jgi:hypothetical protein
VATSSTHKHATLKRAKTAWWVIVTGLLAHAVRALTPRVFCAQVYHNCSFNCNGTITYNTSTTYNQTNFNQSGCEIHCDPIPPVDCQVCMAPRWMYYTALVCAIVGTILYFALCVDRVCRRRAQRLLAQSEGTKGDGSIRLAAVAPAYILINSHQPACGSVQV